jgi:hypothetical protein
MKRCKFLLLLLTTVSISSFAQHSIQGKVLDKQNEGSIEMATIRLLNANDSTLVQGCLSDDKGSFILSKVKDGKYILSTSFLGYNKSLRNVEMAGKSLILRNTLLVENNNLHEVEVRGMTAQVSVKKDTIEYNAAAFKTAENAVVEDLLKKLPGVEVDASGNIKVNGVSITQVRVDGKKFFTGDVQMATKNLPVDMVDKVQVLDQKSDVSSLTGFEDDNTERIINLTIKANRKKGVFGNAAVGGGADMDKKIRYDNSAFVNIMNGDTQTAIIGGANNTNTQRSGRGRTGMSGGSGNNGITTTQNIGINSSTEISKMLKIGGDGTVNHTNNFTETSSERESWLSGSSFDNKDLTTSNKDNKEANMRLEIEWTPDSVNTLIIQPTLNYTKSNSSSTDDFTYYSKDGASSNINFADFTDNDRISWGNTDNSSTSDDISSGLNLILNHKSKVKQGRSIMLNVGGSLSNTNSDGQNYTKKITADSTSIIDQHTKNTSDSYSGNVRLSFVEPLWNQKNLIQATVSMNVNTRSSDKYQYNKDPNSGIYNVLDETYSNKFNNDFYDEAAELDFRHQETDYNYMLGMKVEPSQTFSTTNYLDGEVLKRNNNVINMSPSATFRYNFGKRKFARLEYRGKTTQPSVDQMQPVKNNNNLMNETLGNPSLNPSFNQSLNLMYSSFNSDRFSSFNATLSGNLTQNALVTNSIYDATGKQWSQTVNSEKAPFNASANIMFNTPVIKNRLQFSTQTQLGYGQSFGYSKDSSGYTPSSTTNLILGDLSKTISESASEALSLTFTTDVIEIGTRGSLRYSNTQNNLNNNNNQETWDWTGTGNVNLHLPYSINIANDLSYTTRTGYSNYDKNELVWNASIDKSVFKKRGTLALKVYDILQQKQNISASVGDNYRQISHYNALTSYFTLSFTYRIAKFGGNTTGADMFGGGRRSGGFGGGPGLGGPGPGGPGPGM